VIEVASAERPGPEHQQLVQAEVQQGGERHDHHARGRPTDALEEQRADGEHQDRRHAQREHDERGAAAGGDRRVLAEGHQDRLARQQGQAEQGAEGAGIEQPEAPDTAAFPRVPGAPKVGSAEVATRGQPSGSGRPGLPRSPQLMLRSFFEKRDGHPFWMAAVLQENETIPARITR
jgi:hypothetical protein